MIANVQAVARNGYKKGPHAEIVGTANQPRLRGCAHDNELSCRGQHAPRLRKCIAKSIRPRNHVRIQHRTMQDEQARTRIVTDI